MTILMEYPCYESLLKIYVVFTFIYKFMKFFFYYYNNYCLCFYNLVSLIIFSCIFRLLYIFMRVFQPLLVLFVLPAKFCNIFLTSTLWCPVFFSGVLCLIFLSFCFDVTEVLQIVYRFLPVPAIVRRVPTSSCNLS